MSVRDDVRDLIARATPGATEAERRTLAQLDQRFDEPLTVAVAGMVKAGKSTLVNAVLGEQVAPTDAGECTRIVTWYGHGTSYAVEGERHDGRLVPLPFSRRPALEVDLGGADPVGFQRLRVRSPNQRLLSLQLVDTPGLESLSRDVSERSRSFLAGGGGIPVDAVVYLLRHRHPADVDFLEAFHGGVAATGPMNAIGVLSRADELAGGASDAMAVAARVAETLSDDPRLRALCQTVVPVNGLLAETATTLRDAEAVALRTVAEAPPAVRDAALLTVDRFRGADDLGVDDAVRTQLLERLGLFGLRAAVALAADGHTSVGPMSDGLAAASGIGALRAEIRRRFRQRASTLRSRAILGELGRLSAVVDDPDLARRRDQIEHGAVELAELRVLETVRLGGGDVAEGDRDEVERLLGQAGPDAPARLGLPDETGPDDARTAAFEALRRWQRRAEHPLATPDATFVARSVVRSLEALLTQQLR